MWKYVFAVEPFRSDFIVTSPTEVDAKSMLWNSFTDEERDIIGSIELIDVLKLED